MGKSMSRMGFAFLLSTVLFMLLFPSVYCTQSLSNEVTQGRVEIKRQISQDTLAIDVWISLAGHYDFFNLDIHHKIAVNITIDLATLPTAPYVVYATIPFSSIEKLDLPPGANYTYGFWGYPRVGMLSTYLPANTSRSSIRLEGYLTGKSVFWRNSATVPVMNITSPGTYISSYRLFVVSPSPSKVLRVYSRVNPDLRYQEATIEGQRCFVIRETWTPMVVLYESASWGIYALLLMFTTILVFFILPYASKHEKIGAMTQNLTTMFRQRIPRKLVAVSKRIYKGFLGLGSSKLLTVYVLCGLLMTSLSFVAGPDPRLKVYVFTSTPENARTINSFVNMRGGVTVSTLDESGETLTLANLGVFEAAIIADFLPPRGRQAEQNMYPAITYIPAVIILKPYAFEGFSSEVQSRYADKTTVVDDFDGLDTALRDIHRRTNVLGLDVSPATYTVVSAFVGLCSFIIVFLGLAFLASKLIEVGRSPGFGGFTEAIAYVILYIAFTQAIYIVCSVLLAMPLGLHTVRTTKVTAVGLLGFGGGSNPRMLAGIAGFFFGAFKSLREGLKLEKAGFMAFLAVTFFVIVDPLTNGVIFYEFILLNTVGPYFETALTTLSYVKSFLGQIGVALGGWASPNYPISTGMILYYASAISFYLFPKLKSNTATMLLFISVFFTGTGGIRVADMNPWQTFASLIPGVMAGFIFAAVFWLISFVETFIRTKIGRGSSN